MRFLFLTSLYCFLFASNLFGNNIIISSSPLGRYVVFIDSRNKSELLIADNDSKKLLDKINCDKFFLVWENDSTFLLTALKNNNDTVSIFEYNINRKQKKLLSSFEKEVFISAYQSKLFAMPHHLKNKDDCFVAYADNGKLFKYFPLKNKTTAILNLNKILGQVDINNISINSEGTHVLISYINKMKSGICDIDIVSETKKVIESGKEFANDGNLIFYAKDESKAVFYKYKSNNIEKQIQVIMYNLKTGKNVVLTTLHDLIPTMIIDIPYENSLYIDIIDVRNDIEVAKSKNVLEDIFEGIIGRFTILVVDYATK